jgi:hypothetical protein
MMQWQIHLCFALTSSDIPKTVSQDFLNSIFNTMNNFKITLMCSYAGTSVQGNIEINWLKFCWTSLSRAIDHLCCCLLLSWFAWLRNWTEEMCAEVQNLWFEFLQQQIKTCTVYVMYPVIYKHKSVTTWHCIFIMRYIGVLIFFIHHGVK